MGRSTIVGKLNRHDDLAAQIKGGAFKYSGDPQTGYVNSVITVLTSMRLIEEEAVTAAFGVNKAVFHITEEGRKKLGDTGTIHLPDKIGRRLG